jgi:hypothetical protein
MKIPLIAILGLMVIVPIASAGPHVFIRGGFYGPAYWGPGWYGPGWAYGPGYYWGPGYYGEGISPTGSVKIDTRAKDALVYVDGGYAGKVGDLKTFHVKTGEHDIELRDPSGHAYFQEHVNVLPGKTLNLNPNAIAPSNGGNS